MAHFTKSATGWRAQVKVKGVRDSRMFDTKAEAQAWAAKRETEMRSIESGMGSKTHTVGDVLDKYQKDVSPKKWGSRWEILLLELIGRKEIEGKGRDRSGLRNLTFHDTRHEAITRLAKKLQPLALARMTGHTDLNELMTYYNESAADIAALLD
ncbi:hypothetical protein UB46_34680 [Burkholderiaceae bacterium 16]|nr:hypothetical protein UB46_34680 [Burkholderiaceae bacterium 16]